MLIETDRLFLRDFEPNDWESVHAYSTDPEVVRFMEWGPNSREDTLAFLAGVIAYQESSPRKKFELAVVRKDDRQLIGAAGIRVMDNDCEQADIGYCYGKSAWGQGFATEACRALIRFGFSELGLHRIWATCDRENIGSARVLESSGMRREGCFQQDKKIKGRWRDTLLFAILRSEWSGARGDGQEGTAKP